jgi:MFS family permease
VQPLKQVSTPLLVAAIFVQMLPATLLAPAIRPLFALRYAGQEGAMHAFMAVNMAGAIAAAPFIGRWVERSRRTGVLLALLCMADGALLVALGSGAPVGLLLALRTLEGAAHVSAASLLLATASAVARSQQSGRIMGLSGMALMLAIACGSAFGGVLVERHVELPFWVGGAIAIAVGALALSGRFQAQPAVARSTKGAGPWAVLRREPELVPPVVAAMVARFTVGALIVTFALFAHRVHELSDAEIGGLYALLTLPFALATYPMARVAERAPPSAVMVVGFALCGSCMYGLGKVPTDMLPWAMMGAGVGSAAIFAPILVYAAALGGQDRATVMSMVNAAGCAGMLIGPAAAGLLSHHVTQAHDPVTAHRAVFAMAGLACAAWVVAFLPWVARRARREGLGWRVAHVLFGSSSLARVSVPPPSFTPPPQTGG